MGIRTWSNCLVFAVLLYRRRARKGDAGYIAMRRSRHGCFPHFLYVHRGRRWISYCPINPKLKTLPPPLFDGRVRWGDAVSHSHGGSVDESPKP